MCWRCRPAVRFATVPCVLPPCPTYVCARVQGVLLAILVYNGFISNEDW